MKKCFRVDGELVASMVASRCVKLRIDVDMSYLLDDSWLFIISTDHFLTFENLLKDKKISYEIWEAYI